MKKFARAREAALRDRLPTEEEFGRLWARGVNDQLRELAANGGLLGLGAARAEYVAYRPFLGLGASRGRVRFSWAQKKDEQGPSGAWMWPVSERLWGWGWLPRWIREPLGKARARSAGGPEWTRTRLDRACSEALARYALKDVEASGPLAGHPPAVGALVEADEISRSCAPSSGRSPDQSRL